MPTTTIRKHKTGISRPASKTAHAVPTMTAAQYFRAKLDFETTPHQLKADMDGGKVWVLDVRDTDSYDAEHILGAKNIPMAELANNLATLPKNKTIVTYCWNITCALAPKAALFLAEKGFNVQELVGGISEWKTKSFPTQGRQTA